ncbi:MAG: hypothetical protein D6786_08805 [Gammaproteobacteria bacterium]|nr:MAG: hypothetical protein D6786_08805 [Gammaproteobacteria bacterium]
MNPALPGGLAAAGILFWGWQTGHLPTALPAALALELHRLYRPSFTPTDRLFERLTDLLSLLLALFAAWAFIRHGSHGVFRILEWLPLLLLPLPVAQRLGGRDGVPLSALFLSLRQSPEGRREADLAAPHFCLCLVSAAVANRPGPGYYLTLCLLLAAWLWSRRPRGRPLPLFLLLFMVAATGGHYTARGLRQAQSYMEGMVLSLLDDLFWQDRDPDTSRTAIGSIGRLKLSQGIRLRVEADRPLESTLLLREAAYDRYRNGNWSATGRGFTPLDHPADGRTWVLVPGPPGEAELTIHTRLWRESGVIPLPHGATTLRIDGALGLERNPYGTVRLEYHPGRIGYRVRYRPGGSADPPPGPADLEVPESYRAPLDRQLRDWGLAGLKPGEAVPRLAAIFARDFRYSLVRRGRFAGGTPLLQFLSRTHAGHCEYFASASVLLLRRLGIPARYVVGYAVEEYSPLEGLYVVRSRHAHSWAIAWLEGRWRTVDNTPAVWAGMEAAQAPAWTPVYDFFAWLRHRLQPTAGIPGQEEKEVSGLQWLLLPLCLWLAWSIWRRHRSGPRRKTPPIHDGKDSPFYRLVRRISRRRGAPRPGETLQAWLQRVLSPQQREEVEGLLALHYRYRFDPASDGQALKRHLRQEVESCLRRLET